MTAETGVRNLKSIGVMDGLLRVWRVYGQPWFQKKAATGYLANLPGCGRPPGAT